MNKSSDKILSKKMKLLLPSALLIVCTSCSERHQEENLVVNSTDKCVERVHQYVSEKKGWLDSTYKLKILPDQDGNKVYSVLHQDDELLRPPGRGKSFEVHLDQACTNVLVELQYQ